MALMNAASPVSARPSRRPAAVPVGRLGGDHAHVHRGCDPVPMASAVDSRPGGDARLAGALPPFEEFAITADEIVGGDGLAFVCGTYARTIGGPTRVADRGNYMGLMRKQPDGSWLWTTDTGRVRAAGSEGVIFDPGSSMRPESVVRRFRL